jgi:hypothetical protein
MTKKQKLIFWSSFALFAIPELLWSPVLNYAMPFYKGSKYIFNDNFIFDGNHYTLLSFIILIQLVAVIGMLYIWYKFRSKADKSMGYIILTFILLTSLVTLFSTYLNFTLGGSDLLGL